MKNFLYILILILAYSCKEKDNINPEQKEDNKNNEVKNTSDQEALEIGNLYRPEKMIIKQNRIEKNFVKEDYRMTITNSDLLDRDLKNIKKHARKIASLYYLLLLRNNKPLNLKKIIVKIEHKNETIDSFQYSEENISQLSDLK